MDEIHLIKNAQKSDLESYNDIVLACQDEAYTLAFSILGNVELACKVVQEAFLRVYYTYTRGGDSHKIVLSVLQEVIFFLPTGDSIRIKGSRISYSWLDSARVL